ncbi:MAG: 1-deoxy-D-xylulose-5-phosphate synthase [Bacteroidales bacterium]|nr:1-deoxy-D-xylulose-5-phosphate synthase [Bacteroidales bacterium]
MTSGQYPILSRVVNPSDLKCLNEEELPGLCREIREYIIDVVSVNPGHLAASLGVVELTVALHYVFDAPDDKIIWDVGHQAYAHKILTGRRDLFPTNRHYHGISGFPRMAESSYDAFGTGHSSTSISAALGMAIAAQMQGNTGRNHVAVIGDGAISSGMAMEGLNNAGVSGANLLVILNDNGIAIDNSVGAIKEYLVDITTSRSYNRLKDFIWKLMGGNTKYGANSRAIVKQIGNAFKSSILRKSNLFEAFHFRYFGPTDGHDVIRLVKLLRDLRRIPGPRLLHVITRKGKGLECAEREPTTYHAPGQFDKRTGEIVNNECPGKLPPRYQTVFGRTIIELAEIDDRVVGITPAMPTGCSLNMMMEKIPERAFDVGIAEQHAVTFAAGLAADGMIPFCNIYSTFLQRAYDQVIHDVALQKLKVIFCIDRGGLVGEDGPTHHGAFDLAYLRSVPGLIVAAPMDVTGLRQMMFTAMKSGLLCPIAIRYPRGRGREVDWIKPFREIPVGKGEKLTDGRDIALLSIGHAGLFVAEACTLLEKEGISAAHFDMKFLKPLDESLLHDVLHGFDRIITVEDGTIVGGLGSAVLEFMSDHNYKARVKRVGIPDRFIGHGSVEELRRDCGLDAEGITEAVRRILSSGER